MNRSRSNENKNGIPKLQRDKGHNRIKPRFSIGFRLISLVVFVALLAGVVGAFTLISISRDSLRQEVLNANMTQAALVAQFAAKYISARQSNIREFASNPTLRQAVFNNTPEQAQTVMTQFVQVQSGVPGINLMDTQGIQRVHSTAGSATVGQSYTNTEYYQAVVATLKPYLGAPTLARRTGLATIPYVVPIIDDAGQLRAILTGGISMAALSEAIVSTGFGKDTTASIIDTRNGGLIVGWWPVIVARLRLPVATAKRNWWGLHR
jgi:sensor histidine kinase regulating citrate/malate metabolism